MIQPSDEEILGRLHDFENPFVERKAGSDLKDCLKTAVAFANSLPVGSPGVLFVPVYGDGTVLPDQNLDELQLTISKQIGRAYPSINYYPRLLGSKPHQFLAVLIWGSPNRPHFAGPSYVRDGSQSKIASENQFRELIASRNSTVHEILRVKGQTVSLTRYRVFRGGRQGGGASAATVEDCNQFFVTLRVSGGELVSEPMDRVTLNYDNANKRLWIEAEQFM